MKVIVVGINHAGTSAVRTLIAQNKDVQIACYDRNTNISFLGCGIALTVGGEVENVHDLFYCSADKLSAQNCTVKMFHEVIAINTDAQTVTVKDLHTETVFEDHYDKLIYAAGSWPLTIPGISGEKQKLKNVEVCKLFQHAEVLIEKAESPDIKHVAVIGSGYIGVELAEAYQKKGGIRKLGTQAREWLGK